MPPRDLDSCELRRARNFERRSAFRILSSGNTTRTIMRSEQKTTLVLGGTGKRCSRVAKRLRARGVPVRIAPRSGVGG